MKEFYFFGNVWLSTMIMLFQEQKKDGKNHTLGLNQDFSSVREEGVLFVCPSSSQDKSAPPLSYWVVG